MKGKLLIIVFSFFILITIIVKSSSLSSLVKQAENNQKGHYVSSDGTASWSESVDINTPCSISTANSNAAPGDTVYLREGTYDNIGYVCSQNSGTSDSTRIVYSNYNGEIVTFTNLAKGIVIDGKSYITVNGLNFYSMDGFMYIQNNANHNVISYCTFDKSLTLNSAWGASDIYYSSQYNWIHHCTFSRWRYHDKGALLDIGLEGSATDTSFYNLIEDNTIL